MSGDRAMTNLDSMALTQAVSMIHGAVAHSRVSMCGYPTPIARHRSIIARIESGSPLALFQHLLPGRRRVSNHAIGFSTSNLSKEDPLAGRDRAELLSRPRASMSIAGLDLEPQAECS
jgi:hypothetical protein